MGYNIYMAAQEGLIIPSAKVPEFADDLAKAAVEELKRHSFDDDNDFVEAKKARDAILAASSLTRKVVLLHDFLENKVFYPFVVSSYGDGSLEVTYDSTRWGERWKEGPVEEMVNVLSKYVRRNAYLGFVGEDMAIWSYVFDGMGSSHMVYPQIDWTGTQIKDEDGEEES